LRYEPVGDRETSATGPCANDDDVQLEHRALWPWAVVSAKVPICTALSVTRKALCGALDSTAERWPAVKGGHRYRSFLPNSAISGGSRV
jgi:hypothetical protein